MKTTDSVRLPEHIIPERYEILIRPNLKNFTFEGEETISLKLAKPTKEIILHAADLEIEQTKYLDGKTEVEPTKTDFNPKKETVTFTFSQSLPGGEAKLSLKFRGVLNDKLRGFYRSKHLVEGQEKYLATTQFESTDARRAFPCVDEPNRKAIFDVTLMVPQKAVAISNTLPTKIAEHESGYQIVKFSPTPKMSTYLLAFIVGDFEFIEAKTKSGVLVRVFVTPGKKSQAKFALETTRRALEFYEDYFKIPYPLPTMDVIAIPDFQSGAMENWGAVTYRETAILVDEKNTSTINKQYVALVIAHELAHQWFGNLVTMEWWTHLWLNEGFASYMEYLTTDKLFPQWDLWSQFVYLDQGSALSLDALDNTHPIEVEVNDPAEITEIFDAVSYSKGASIIRMLANFLGYKDFRDGLRYYLKKHKFGNAKTEDLWDALEHISKKPVKSVMANWTAKAGYPLLTVLERGELLEILQSRFYSSPKSAKKSKDRTVWSTPVNVILEKPEASRGSERKDSLSHFVASRMTKSYLMEKKNLHIKKPEGWVKVNAEESSFVRVDYPAKYLKLLKEPIETKLLASTDRLGVIRDAFDLAEADKLPTHEVLRLAQDYVNEDDYSVWAELAAGVNNLSRLLYDEKFYKDYQKFGKKLFSPIAAKVGWEKKKDEKHTDTLLRSLVLYSAGTYGVETVIKKAQDLFETYTNRHPELVSGSQNKMPKQVSQRDRFAERHDEVGLEADLRGVVYNLVAENGGEKEYQTLLKLYKTADLQEEKMRLVRALGNFRDPKLLQKTLDFALSKEVRSQDTIFVISAVWVNPEGKYLAWKFVKKNWKILVDRFAGGHLLPRLLEAGKVMNSQKDIEDIKKFFKKNHTPEAKRTIKQVLEQIESNVAWLERDKKGIQKFLSEVV